ncbi:rhodanese-like domain-containing protein [Acidihalobacter yilgarnensis]|uniref:hypothetical protein n=1 Tax=Acidihalobacter yilgarnensis TaxID=2819280 RepID=UPI0012EA52BA|nr:hypothetical protein [Acidihalobacter yilgarnensis]
MIGLQEAVILGDYPGSTFDEGHLPGAINIVSGEIPTRSRVVGDRGGASPMRG